MNSFRANIVHFLWLVLVFLCFFPNLNAQVWTPIQGLPVSANFKSVKFIHTNIGWVSGDNGTILKTTDGGLNWTQQPSGTTNTLRSIFFLDAQNGWACGDAGTIITTNNGGLSWTTQNAQTSNQIFSIQFVTTSIGWASGKGNLLLKTINGGSTWTPQPNQGSDMWGLDMQSATTGWICGGFNSTKGSPTLLKTSNGSSWTFQTNLGVSSFTSFNDIHFTDANQGWMVGANGLIRHTTDGGATAWTAQSSGTQFELLGVDFVNANVGFACGRQGIIIATTNGGTNWVAQNSSAASGSIWEVDMVDTETGFAVGDAGLIIKYSNFVPTQPIELLQPKQGGEIFQIGTARFILWQAQPSVSNVKIEYSTTGNSGPWTTIVASTPAATGSYTWVVPNASSLNCFIRISNTTNPATFDISSAPFFILNTPYGLDYSVLTSATVNNSPPQITISWVNDPNAQSYTIDKKNPADAGWTRLDSVAGTTNTYADFAVLEGIIYEYRIVKTTPLITGFGYIYTGINLPAREEKGTMLIAADAGLTDSLQPELVQYIEDLVGDGWKVVLKKFPNNAKDTAVKNWVKTEYATPGKNVKSLLLIGHFAIPYSGNFAPDGHAERIGAQPADVFYADMGNDWSDNSVSTNNTGNIYTSNFPGDGRWDPSILPSKAELEVGRIDMYDMTGFALSEAGLLKQYFQKNHAYRHKSMNPARRAFINTHLDKQLLTTSAVAWRNFSPLVGPENIGSINTNGCLGTGNCHAFIDSLEANSYLWAYMAGGGSDTSCADPVFTSSQSIYRNIQTVFMQLYGSYFVEWAKGGIDTIPNHLLRAPLANAGMPLATCWTGSVPRWYFQHMAMGESIGFSTLQSQNNTTIYDPGNANFAGSVHMALMGDPSLRLHMVYPVQSLTASQISASIQLQWQASPDDHILGYQVYRSDTISGTFSRLNSQILQTTNFTDSMPSLSSNNLYMVRAVKSETSASGSYQNLSQGIFTSSSVITTFRFTGDGNWTASNNWSNGLVPPATLPAGFSILIDPPNGGQCVLDGSQYIAPGGSIVIADGKKLVVTGLLIQ